ncbi:thioesterase domain-containing protein [Shewanella sp. 202IG2-18]|uniref:thioesterase domain-containing protein n=1 Tax=Parashewanella hymeniacidonis TaxID=2807618 RepID=UPI0019614E20|nr:thioesterase domain-containing protein [Parashewanella hymeniacidonis]MBM7071141.1 thioesterase domain-containing protein [Parashewanella hymeniacidonis]
MTANNQTLLQQLTQTWHNTIPVSQFMQIKPLELTRGTFSVTAPIEPNINCHNTMFAGSLSTLATLTGWGAIWLQQKLNNVNGDIVLADGHIRYLAPVTSQPIAQVACHNFEFSRLVAGKKQRFELKVNIICNQQVCAEFSGQYVSLPVGN